MVPASFFSFQPGFAVTSARCFFSGLAGLFLLAVLLVLLFQIGESLFVSEDVDVLWVGFLAWMISRIAWSTSPARIK